MSTLKQFSTCVTMTICIAVIAFLEIVTLVALKEKGHIRRDRRSLIRCIVEGNLS